MSEELPPRATPDAPSGRDADLSQDAGPFDAARLTDTIAGRLSDQARLTASAAKARRVVNSDGEPGVLDLTPLRQLLPELVAELSKVQLRERIAQALRQAADVIDPQTANH